MVRSLDGGDKLLGFESWAPLLIPYIALSKLCILFTSVVTCEYGNNTRVPPPRVMRIDELILKHLEQRLVHGKHDKSVD